MTGVRRPLFSFLVPSSPASKLRQLSFAAPTLLFGVGAAAVILRQSHYRNELADEAAATNDRIERRSYVALPNGRLAQVYPVVETDLTLCGMWRSAMNSLSLLP